MNAPATDLEPFKALIDARIRERTQSMRLTGSGRVTVTGTPGNYAVSLADGPAVETPEKVDAVVNDWRAGGREDIHGFQVFFDPENAYPYIIVIAGGCQSGIWATDPAGRNLNNFPYKFFLTGNTRIYTRTIYGAQRELPVYAPPEEGNTFLGQYHMKRITAVSIFITSDGRAPTSDDLNTDSAPQTVYKLRIRYNSKGKEAPLTTAEEADEDTRNPYSVLPFTAFDFGPGEFGDLV